MKLPKLRWPWMWKSTHEAYIEAMLTEIESQAKEQKKKQDQVARNVQKRHEREIEQVQDCVAKLIPKLADIEARRDSRLRLYRFGINLNEEMVCCYMPNEEAEMIAEHISRWAKKETYQIFKNNNSVRADEERRYGNNFGLVEANPNLPS